MNPLLNAPRTLVRGLWRSATAVRAPRISAASPRFTSSLPTPDGGRVKENEKFARMTWKSGVAVVVSGLGLLGYYEWQKRKLEERRAAAMNQGAGKPLVGGPFSLVDHDGRPVTDLDFRGKYMLVYFGYTFCPDICPEELEKMALVVDSLSKKEGYSQETIVPIFISCDPKRDSVESIREYVRDFHPKFVGLTGTYAQIKRIAKAYRLYFSAPPRAVDDDETDYLVDHSIFFYLMDPNGKYVAHFGRTDTAEEVTEKVIAHIKEERASKR
ncbi:Cu-binding protein [Borealophlyctis nickersoniae]|nr:Cu-binding protein [Borealophlyctis nickersoniae]